MNISVTPVQKTRTAFLEITPNEAANLLEYLPSPDSRNPRVVNEVYAALKAIANNTNLGGN